MRVASTTVRIGAAAWITAARPESIRVSANARSQYGTALLSVPRTRNGTHIARTSGTAPRRTTTGTSTTTPTSSRPEDHDRGLELVDAELDEEERRAPDRREREEEDEVAPMHPGDASGRAAQPDGPGRLAS